MINALELLLLLLLLLSSSLLSSSPSSFGNSRDRGDHTCVEALTATTVNNNNRNNYYAKSSSPSSSSYYLKSRWIPVPVGSTTTRITKAATPVIQTRSSGSMISKTSSSSSSSALGSSVGCVDVFFRTHRFAAAFLVGAGQGAAADRLAQYKDSSSSSINNNNDFNMRRNVSFLLFGGLYMGMFNEYIFNSILPMVFGHYKFLQGLAACLVFGSYVGLPVAYSIKSLICDGNNTSFIKGGLTKYWNDVSQKRLLLKFRSLWIPVNCINFGFVPTQYRIAVNSIVAFCWLVILSTISSE